MRSKVEPGEGSRGAELSLNAIQMVSNEEGA
jgi:hypothetical protein